MDSNLKYSLPNQILEILEKTGKKPILFDVDDVIHPLERTMKLFYASQTGDESVLINIEQLELSDGKWSKDSFLPKLTDDQKLDMIDSQDFWDFAKPSSDAIDCINKLQENDFEIIFYTSHRPTGQDVKRAWLEKHFPKVNFILFASIHHPKDEYSGFVLIDDQLKHHLVNQSEYKMIFGLNRQIEQNQLPENVDFVDNWLDLYELIISKKA